MQGPATKLPRRWRLVVGVLTELPACPVSWRRLLCEGGTVDRCGNYSRLGASICRNICPPPIKGCLPMFRSSPSFRIDAHLRRLQTPSRSYMIASGQAAWLQYPPSTIHHPASQYPVLGLYSIQHRRCVWHGLVAIILGTRPKTSDCRRKGCCSGILSIRSDRQKHVRHLWRIPRMRHSNVGQMALLADSVIFHKNNDSL